MREANEILPLKNLKLNVLELLNMLNLWVGLVNSYEIQINLKVKIIWVIWEKSRIA